MVRWFISKVEEVIVKDNNYNFHNPRFSPKVCSEQEVLFENYFNPQTREYESKSWKRPKYPNNGWSAIYYPSNEPYELALVRMEFDADIPINPNDIVMELKTTTDWYQVVKNYKCFRYRWKDQALYPAP